jgi:hypothetical protein
MRLCKVPCGLLEQNAVLPNSDAEDGAPFSAFG